MVKHAKVNAGDNRGELVVFLVMLDSRWSRHRGGQLARNREFLGVGVKGLLVLPETSLTSLAPSGLQGAASRPQYRSTTSGLMPPSARESSC